MGALIAILEGSIPGHTQLDDTEGRLCGRAGRAIELGTMEIESKRKACRGTDGEGDAGTQHDACPPFF